MDSMESFEHISESISNDSKDYSFLAEVNTGQAQNGFLNGMLLNLNPDLTNLSSTLSHNSTALYNNSLDASMELVQPKIIKVFKENISLKEKLMNTNGMLKEQMQTICGWKHQMDEKLQEATESFDAAKTKISMLEKENKGLLQKLDALVQQYEELQQKPCEKCENLEPAIEKVKGELDSAEMVKRILVGQLTEKSCSEEMMCQNLATILDYLMCLMQSRKILKKDKEKLSTVIQALNDQVVSLGGDCRTNEQNDEEAGFVVIDKNSQAVPNEEIIAKIESMKNAIEEKDEMINSMKKLELEMSEKFIDCEKRLQQYEQSQKNNFDLLTNKLKLEQTLHEKCKERCESLEAQLEGNHSKLLKAMMSEESKNQEQMRVENKSLKSQLQEEIMKLRSQLEEARMSDDTVTQQLREENKNLQSELNIMKITNDRIIENLREENTKLQLQSQKTEAPDQCLMNQVLEENEKLKAKLEQAKTPSDHALDRLREEKRNLQAILEMEQKDKQKNNEKINELRLKCEKLQVDNDRVTQLLEIQSRDARIKEEEQRAAEVAATANSEIDAEVMKLRSRVDHLTAHLVEKSEQLEVKTTESDKLRKDIEELNKRVIEVTSKNEVIETQMHYYRVDVEDAVKTRDTAVEEIKKLEKKVKELENTISNSTGSNSSRRRSSSTTTSTIRQPLFCPICHAGEFQSVNDVEVHFFAEHDTPLP